MMTRSVVQVRLFLKAAFALVIGVGSILLAGCGRSDVAANNKAATPANAAIAAKPPEA